MGENARQPDGLTLATFDGGLGLGETGGWFYTVIGLISVVKGILSPTLVSRRP